MQLKCYFARCGWAAEFGQDLFNVGGRSKGAGMRLSRGWEREFCKKRLEKRFYIAFGVFGRWKTGNIAGIWLLSASEYGFTIFNLHALTCILMLMLHLLTRQMAFSCSLYQQSDSRAWLYEVPLNHLNERHWLDEVGGRRSLLKVIIWQTESQTKQTTVIAFVTKESQSIDEELLTAPASVSHQRIDAFSDPVIANDEENSAISWKLVVCVDGVSWDN